MIHDIKWFSSIPLFLLLSGCDNKQEELKLASEQLTDMVFVEGGSFMMGDFWPDNGGTLTFQSRDR